MIRHLQNHPNSRVIIEGSKKWDDVAHVVDDVVRGHNVGTRCLVRRLRPETLDRRTRYPALFCIHLELHQHLGLMIHADHVSRRRCEREGGDAGSATHVQNCAPFAQRLTRTIMGWRRLNDVRNQEEF